jgi:hypothetical protein
MEMAVPICHAKRKYRLEERTVFFGSVGAG